MSRSNQHHRRDKQQHQRGQRGDRQRGQGGGGGEGGADAELLIYGVHPVAEALADDAASARAKALWVESGGEEQSRLAAIVGRARERGLEIKFVDRQVLDDRSDEGNHQGVILVMGRFEYMSLVALIEALEGESRALIVALDQVQDVGNFGAIVRSAAAFGASAIVVPKDHSAPVTAAVVRASAGQLFKVPIVQVVNMARAIEALKEAYFWAASTAVSEGDVQVNALWDEDLDRRMVVVLGSEHEGVRRLVKERCDFHVTIPMAAGVESMNVSAAAAVLMYEIRRQWAKTGNEA